METVFEQRFDPRRKFQYINDEPSVMHCHHYITICSQLALQMESLDGPQLIQEAMEETFFLVLKKYYIRYDITGQDEKVKVAEDYFSLSGLGVLNIQVGRKNGSVEMRRSHVDEGWIKKWGKTDEPVNYIGCGYIAAAFALINNRPLRSYEVRETQSIVSGDSVSRFDVSLKKEQS